MGELVLVVGDVEGEKEDKMKDMLNCPVCKKEVFSGVGRGCKMCGMVLESSYSFCCKICMRKYNTINNVKGRKSR